MRKYWIPAAVGGCLVLLLTGCADDRPDESPELVGEAQTPQLADEAESPRASMPLGEPAVQLPDSWFEGPLPDTLARLVCSQETNTYIPVDSIPVTVRAGRLAGMKGHITVPSKDPAGPSEFGEVGQVRHPSPDLQVSSNGQWVTLRVSGHPGGGASPDRPDNAKFEQTINLLRCTQDEGNLVRIHVDAPEKGRPDPGPPSITVTGIYDALTSEEALRNRQYSCIRCGRVEVCGVPACQ
jgi:hypothetical protein